MSLLPPSRNKRPPPDRPTPPPARRVFYGRADQAPSPAAGDVSYWSVQWRKPQFKKHKTWDGDGILIVRGGKCFLKDENGKDIGSAPHAGGAFASGDELRVGGKEVELDCAIPAHDYISGNCFSPRSAPTPASPLPARAQLAASARSTPTAAAGGGGWRPPAVLRNAFKPPLPAAGVGARRPATPVLAPNLARAAAAAGGGEGAKRQAVEAGGKEEVRVKHEPMDVDAFDDNDDDGGSGLRPAPPPPPAAPAPPAVPPRPQVQTSSTAAAASRWAAIDASSDDDEPSPAAGEPSDDDDLPTATQAIKRRVAHLAFRPPPAPAATAASSAAPPAAAKAQLDKARDGAVVMKRPNRDHQLRNNPKGYPVTDVVLDPLLADRMRPHQRDGVRFLYECVLGLRRTEGNGAILADEMGLGKTLQTIALIWTLLKQTPYVNPLAPTAGLVGKVLIACPVSLTANWSKEFRKWLGRDRVGVFLGDGDKAQIRQFATSRRHQVLVIGYEKLRTVMDDLRSCQPPIGLIICDEGHRLKSKDAKTSKMFDQLNTKRRVILSGTPLQNDLGEFWSMVDFINPGILDTYPAFNKIFEKPILKSRTPGCNRADLELGQGRAAKLNELSRQFILRRTADVISKFLPPKREYVVFVAPTELQLRILRELLKRQTVESFTRIGGPGAKAGGGGQQPLSLIMYARMICNSPMLFKKDDAKVVDTASHAVRKARAMVPDDRSINDIACSGKLLAVSDILAEIKANTDEKVVIVSNFTKALDVLEALCRLRKYSFERLDGSTPQAKRGDMVDRFNRGSQTQSFVFLLSSKSGGAGLNLIGASRLVMLDCDWNPSTDQQAMARIHRDGQQRDVFIYRLLTVGTIDEKIYQRQVTKLGLSDVVMGNAEDDASSGADTFTADELRALFKLETRTACATHDLIACDCLYETLPDDAPAASRPPRAESSDDSDDDDDEQRPFICSAANIPPPRAEKNSAKEKEKLAALKQWSHIQCVAAPVPDQVQDAVLLALIRRAAREGLPPGDAADLDAGARDARTPDARDDSDEGVGGGGDGRAPSTPSGRAYEREVSWEPTPPPPPAAQVPRSPPHSAAGDSDADSCASPPVGARWADVDDDVDGGSGARSASPPIRSAGGKGKAREKLFLDGSGSEGEDAGRASGGGGERGAAARRAPGGKRAPPALWPSAVDTYQMAQDGGGGRICFLFEKISLGGE